MIPLLWQTEIIIIIITIFIEHINSSTLHSEVWYGEVWNMARRERKRGERKEKRST